MDIARVRKSVLYVPKLLRPLVVYFNNDCKRSGQRGIEYLKPLIEERRMMLEEYGNEWSEKPNDMLMWLIEQAAARGQGIDMVVNMVLMVNFAAIHTSSSSYVHALYHLAANPEYIKPLREEVEAVIREDGWTKLSMQKMRKIDSFLRESQRFNGVNALSVMRMMMKDVTLSDGTYIPKGTFVAATAASEHRDESHYTNPHVFDPWRFSNMREDEGKGLRHQFVSTSVDYIAFGHGKHACPGRFFAANELKAMLAHTVLNYDVKLEREGRRPDNIWLGVNILPSPTTNVMFRKRQD